MAERVAFIDLEASGLNAQSWPIEVGWCFPGVAPKAHLVRPSSNWIDAAWDPRAEALHGISRSELDAGGVQPAELCRLLNDELSLCTVYSDAPDWDGFWLYRLFGAAGRKQRFELRDFREAFDGVPDAAMDAHKRAAMQLAPHTHRAAPDVLHMRTLYELAGIRN